jgi:hypothetical protein
MGATGNYGLRKPTDPAAPADFITIVGALADDVDAALKREVDGRAPAGHNHDGAYPGTNGARAGGTWGISITGSAGYAPSAGNADTVDGQHFQHADRGESLPYVWAVQAGQNGDNRLMHVAHLGGSHNHNPGQSGIGVIHHNFGSLSAGQTKSQRFARANDQYPVVCVNHSSTYILAVIHSLDNGGFTVEVRNSTSGTNHTNVHVIVHLVRAA